MLLRFTGSLLFWTCFVLPLLSSILLTLLFSLGYLSPLALTELGEPSYKVMFDDPRFFKSIYLTTKVSLVSTSLSLLIVFVVSGNLYPIRGWKKFERILPFLLSYPHVAFSIGLVFLISPSGLFFRALSDLIPQLKQPLALVTYQDSGGYSLIIGLIFKEVPFLLFMVFAKMNQINLKGYYQVARTMGYSSFKTWSKIIWPQIYPSLQFPVLIVLSYSSATIDMAYILGPSSPLPLVRLILEWFQNENLAYQSVASTGAIFFLFLLSLMFMVWKLGEKMMSKQFQNNCADGRRGTDSKLAFLMSSGFLYGLVIIFLLTFLINLTWSVTKMWTYPFLIPQTTSLDYWTRLLEKNSLIILFNSISIAIVTALISLSLSIILLEGQFFLKKPIHTKEQKLFFSCFMTLIYLPLFIPQIILLLGIQKFFFYIFPYHHTWLYLQVSWTHFFFVFPYVYLTLSDSYQRYDRRYVDLAKTFTENKYRIFLKIKWLMLLKPLLFSLSIGFSVSFMDYLSTVIMGSGRIETITTESVHLSVGGNRRLTGVYSTLQMIFPFMVFLGCILIQNRFDKRMSYSLISRPK